MSSPYPERSQKTKPLPSPRQAPPDPVKEKDRVQGLALIENLVAAMGNKKFAELPPLLESLKELPSAINLQFSGETVLHCAARCGLLPVIKVLYSIPGLDVNAPSSNNWDAPLHSANEHADVVAFLLYIGADPYFANKLNVKAIYEAKGESTQVFDVYIKDGRAGLLRDWPSLAETKAPFSPLAAYTEFDCLLRKSNSFQQNCLPIPTTANTIKVLGTDTTRKTMIAEFASGTRIVVHQKLKSLIQDFLETKLRCGTTKEKKLYTGMTIDDFVRRLVAKRPLNFFTHLDTTVLRNGREPEPSDWPRVGSDNEGEITIEEYMTYDEIGIASLIGASTPTFFINSGSRTNGGKEAKPPYPTTGIYIGLVGARFEKTQAMESIYVIIQPDDSKLINSEIAKVWARFWLGPHYAERQSTLISHQQVSNLPQHKQKSEYPVVFSNYFPKDPLYFNVAIYKRRMEITVDTFLAEANDRAREAGKHAFCHVVGLGLGIWQVSLDQPTYILDVFSNSLRVNKLPYIKNVDFSWFPEDSSCSTMSHEQYITTNSHSIQVSFSKRNPADLLTGEHENKLLVAMYAWDGNSFPGNEYWAKILTASGDPAAACCSLIPELQNPEINLHLLNNVQWVEPEYNLFLGS